MGDLKKREQDEKNERDTYLDDLRYLLRSPQGMRFFKKFFEDGHIFRSTFTGNSQTFFLEGHRNFALKYFADICEAAPEKVQELIIKKEQDQ